MRFLMLMIPGGDARAARGSVPDPARAAAMARYGAELQRAGVLLALDRLHPPSAGARLSFRSGKPRIVDGPFPAASGVVGGYGLIDVKSRAEALQWAARCPASGDEVIEVRAIVEGVGE